MPGSGNPPVDERERLAALRRAELLDTPPEAVFDRLTKLAAELLRVPVAVVAFVDAEREFFKSAVGLPGEWSKRRETPRAISLAEVALLANAPLAIEDARMHPLVKDNPIIPEWGIVSYAAVPLQTKDGHAIGSVYVADKVPRAWTETEITALTTIAIAAETEIALRIALKDTERARTAMQTMLERVPYAVFTVNREWRITFGNDKAQAVLLSNCSTLVGLELWASCSHLRGTELELQLRHAMSAPAGSSFEGYLTASDCWYEASAEPSEEGLTVFFKDVSARRRSDDALLESERRYRFVFEEALTCNLVTSPDGRVFACNRAFVSAFGFTSMEHALTPQAHALWRDIAQREEMIDALRKHGRFGPAEVHTKRVDGADIVMMLTAIARFEKGELTEIHSCMLDISEQKKLEAQFRQAQKMEAVGQLAGGMAHDFNNLLTVIKAYVQLALSELEDAAPLREDMQVIGDAADRAAELTRQLLAFSRQQVLMPMRISLKTIITGIEPMIRTLLGPEVTLVDDIERPIPDIEADRSQLEQVLVNLAVNARDAMPNGGTITFALGEEVVTPLNAHAHEGAPAGSYVTLAVRDSGVGMSQKTAAQIFEPFFTTKAPGKGTGLGLSTVYGIVKQSGGHIKVSSLVGVGTTFTICLPAAPSLETTAARISAGDRAGIRVTDGVTVLVVDDDEPVRRALTRSLSRVGFTVLEAADGVSALDLAAAHKATIDLLLTDVEMPGMQGPLLAEQLRGILPNLRVLFMSGSSSSNGRSQTSDVTPQYQYVAKPFTADELAVAVRSALGSPAA
ncbi:MAG: response regulator [Gemmatimonadaceae bacterium]|nr:response regulator [Gemmatimonadaceae bacterium]